MMKSKPRVERINAMSDLGAGAHAIVFPTDPSVDPQRFEEEVGVLEYCVKYCHFDRYHKDYNDYANDPNMARKIYEKYYALTPDMGMALFYDVSREQIDKFCQFYTNALEQYDQNE